MKMKRYADFDEYLAGQRPKNQTIIRSLRKLVKRLTPALAESVKWGNGCWVKDEEPVAYVYSAPTYVQFGFFRGSALKDPKKLLEGQGKFVRHIKVRATSDIDERAYGTLLKQAAHRRRTLGAIAGLAAAAILMSFAGPAIHAEEKEPPKVAIPEPGVPQIMTLEGRFIRVAYNNEGYAIIGYRLANYSVGQEWMLLEAGFTLRDAVPNYDMPREALSIETPDGRTIPLATVTESREAPTDALKNRLKTQSDKINYFPPNARDACRVGFFSDLDSGAPAWDRVELSSRGGCLGLLYFHVPGGIKHGQHWLNVKFTKSVVRVPFRILTDEEYKLLDKNYKDIEKQIEQAFKKKN